MLIMLSYNDLKINYISRDLHIQSKNLNSLTGSPNHVSGTFQCYANNLTNLIGGPQQVDGDYRCALTNLTDLVGCASHIGGSLDCCYSKITSLVGIHKIIKRCNGFYFDSEKVTQGGIGLLLIDNLTKISKYFTPFDIISKYLGSGTKGMMECSKELMAKGYEDYAKL